MSASKHKISLLYPDFDGVSYSLLSARELHDLGIDQFCRGVSSSEKEQNLVSAVFASVTSDYRVAKYRADVFEDLYQNKDTRNSIKDLLEQIQVIKDFGILRKEIDKKTGLWGLLHKLDSISDYIKCVESLRELLSNDKLTSDGLKDLREYVNQVYEDSMFEAMKEDISRIKVETSNLQSVTVGINLNERFEARSIGLVSVNSEPFVSSGIVSSFSKALASKDNIKPTSNWDGDMHYEPIDVASAGLPGRLEKMAGFTMLQNLPAANAEVRNTIVNMPEDDTSQDVTYYLERVAGKMLNHTSKRLREILLKYASISISDVTNLVPEFKLFILMTEYVEKLRADGYVFNKASVSSDEASTSMDAEGFYNLKLLGKPSSDIVPNDLNFDEDNCVYVLTGANRGGKTTLTQAVGQLFVLAQAGVYVPCKAFSYRPVDHVFTHFPADEDKTLDLGRLGEECQRFKEIYKAATAQSLVLLNETFSTTSFEEGYYIAKDSVRALLAKSIRTIYNTHMHKLAMELDSIDCGDKKRSATSLVMQTNSGERSFKVKLAPPEGSSFAHDIAVKYGVTFEMLTSDK